MNEETPASFLSLTDQSLRKLRKLAEGNHLDETDIQLLGSEEKIYTLKGVMTLEPIVEKAGRFYPGPVQTKGAIMSADSNELKNAVNQKSSEITKKSDWHVHAIQKLNEQPGDGWGLDDVKITIPQSRLTLAASPPCPQCRGQRMTPCPQCNGQGMSQCHTCNGTRYEVCYNCHGYGVNPQAKDQPCMICSTQMSVIQNGLRCIACRTCQGTGLATCQTCQGRRGLPCQACKATGVITEEVILDLVIRTHFTMIPEAIPSGMRRGLDRLGMANLAKGYADIQVVEAPQQEEPELPAPLPGELAPEEARRIYDGENSSQKSTPEHPPPEIYYEAKVPYADLRMDFKGKKAIVSAFGKKGALLGVPYFIDHALENARQTLKEAAHTSPNAKALTSTRLIREVLELQIQHSASVKDLKKLYPWGLSNEVAKEITDNTRLALNLLTLQVRRLVAVASTALSLGSFYAFYFTPLHQEWLHFRVGRDWIELAPLLLALGLSWFILSFSICLSLKKVFPHQKISPWQKIGKTGGSMLSVIGLAFFIALAMAPSPPSWLLPFLSRLHLVIPHS